MGLWWPWLSSGTLCVLEVGLVSPLGPSVQVSVFGSVTEMSMMERNCSAGEALLA